MAVNCYWKLTQITKLYNALTLILLLSSVSQSWRLYLGVCQQEVIINNLKWHPGVQSGFVMGDMKNLL